MTASSTPRWNPHSKTRLDLFGCIDVLAVHPVHGILGVQATTQTNVAARIDKVTAEPRLGAWLQAGGSFEVWGWAKRGARGKRKLWTASRRKIGLEDLRELRRKGGEG